MRSFLVAIVLALACSQVAQAHYLLDLDEAQRKVLGQNLTEQMETVQNGIKKDLKFDSVAEAVEFLHKCRQVRRAVVDAQDFEFDDMAGDIKYILGAEIVDEACSVNEENFKVIFATFDQDYSPSLSSVSEDKVSELRLLKQKVESDEGLRSLVGHLIAQRADKFIPKPE